ncbi:MAG TPA: sensor histidine kinase [Symbiobacteriaceae bacterium]|nr:sensor histidine kinase [Symbiobacteriaceae bacterium]
MTTPSIRLKLLAVVVLLTVTLGVAVTVQLRTALLRTAGAELDKRSISIAADLAMRVTEPLLTRNTLDVRDILLDIASNNPDVRYALVVDSQNRLVAHTFQGGFPRDLLAHRPVQLGDNPDLVILQSDEGPLHDAAAPIVGGLAGHVRVGLTETHLVASLRQVERLQVITVILVGLTALGAAYYGIFRLTRRVQDLALAARRVGAGDMTPRVAPGAPDELGILAGAFNEMTERLAAAGEAVRAKEQARTELLQKVLTAQEEERGRISRELHDEIGQALTGLIVGLKVLKGPTDAQRLRDVAAATLESVRRLSRDLRPAVLDDIGLVAALRRYTEDFSRLHGIEGTLQVVGHEETRLAPAVETTLYRVVQEALTNVARHSGARHFGVVLDLRGPVIQAIVEDDGRGFDPASPKAGMGLASMTERTALVGGAVTIESRPGGGATVYVKVPAEEGDRAHSDC